MNQAGSHAPQPSGELDLGDVRRPLWILPFDSAGSCVAAQTRAHLIGEVASGRYTDVFLFSHGWNNTFERAKQAYARFITGYHQLVRSHHLPQPDGYRPLLIGLHWPSIDLVLPWERAPKIAALPGDADQPMALDAMAAAAEETLGRERATRLQALARQPQLTETEATELAGLLAEAYPDDDELGLSAGGLGSEEILETWSELIEDGLTEDEREPSGPEAFRPAREDRPAAAPAAAGALGRLRRFDPRDILRAFTVYKMKDRAGLVGQQGAGPFLRECLKAPEAPRLHLIGHSYGGRLVLAAVCAEPLPRKVNSMLLLQAAVNYLCFAHQVPKTSRPGAFRPALDQVEQPILCTFSDKDKALRDFFHVAVRRRADRGELKMAALGQVPSLYAALGGWGPGGLDASEALELDLAKYPDRYDLQGASHRIYALNGKTGISGHSDVSNEWTYWALYNQVAPEPRADG